MEAATNELTNNLTVSSDDEAELNDSSVSDSSNHVGVGSLKFTAEEVRCALETSAFTGRFGLDWEELKSILSYHLKQILSEYPEAKTTEEQQISLLGETFQGMVKRLDNALSSFDEGPPFTLQRICEILMSAKSIYPKLAKLALALEKNLLVTSTLLISDDWNQSAIKHGSNEDHEGFGKTESEINKVQNGEEPGVVDKDEIMTDVEEVEANDIMTIDMETVGVTSEANSSTTMD